MTLDRKNLNATPAIKRRPAVSNTVQRSAAEKPPSLARSLQERLGNQASQLLIARAVDAPSKASRLPTKVSKPNDPAELEAEETARKVMRMQQPPATKPATQKGTAKGVVQRAEAALVPAPAVPAAASSSRVNISGGSPLPSSVRSHMEPRFGANFGNVRIHTGADAAHQSVNLNARAFTVGEHIFFGKDKFQPQSEGGRELIAHELTHTIQQGAAIQRSVDTTVTQRSEPQVQRNWLGDAVGRVAAAVGRFSISDALNWIGDKANNIPGFRLLTIVLGMNPITLAPVTGNAANLLRALLELIPIVGPLIAQALDNYGIFARVGAWMEGQVRSLGLVGGALKSALTTFLNSLSWTDIFSLDEVYERGKRIFTDPIDRLINFGKSLATDILGFIREAILLPLARLAEGTSGYDLLKAVLGQDPITGQPVPRNAETLIGGFMKFIGHGEVWENIKRGNAVARAWAWFQGALEGLMGFLRQIPTLFMNTLRSLEVVDLILPLKAFAKVANVFGGFAVRFVTWAGSAVWNLLEIIFDVVSPGALAYIKRTGAALRSILQNPLPFVGNLVRAAKLGFTNFADNFVNHLKAGLIDWLTGSLEGVYIPRALSLAELGKFAISVLGISWAQIRGKIVKVLGPSGETIMKAMETGFDIVVALVTGGPAAAWELIKEKLSDLKDQVVSGIIGFVTDTIVKKAIPKLIAMFIPGAGFISAIISIYDTVMVFVEKISKIIQVVTAFIDSIVAIAGGNITAAAQRVERILANLLSLSISFLAGFLGLGKVTDKIMEVIKKVRTSVDKAIDAAIAWIVDKAKKLFARLFGKKDKPDERTDAQKEADLNKAVADAEKALDKKGATPKTVEKDLLGIKTKYRLTSIVLVKESSDGSKETDHVVAEINPKKPTKPKTFQLKSAELQAIEAALTSPKAKKYFNDQVNKLGEQEALKLFQQEDARTSAVSPQLKTLRDSAGLEPNIGGSKTVAILTANVTGIGSVSYSAVSGRLFGPSSKLRLNAVSKTHAEGVCMTMLALRMDAANVQGGTGHILVDKPPCGYCEGAITSMRNQYKVEITAQGPS